MDSLTGKIAVVTGGTAGIGAATAELLAQRGAAVVVCGRNQERGALFVEKGRKAGLDLSFVTADCSLEQDISRLFAETVSERGPVDMVFANAGVEDRASHADTTKEIWDRLIANDLTSAYLTCRYAIDSIKAGGAICVMSSIVANVNRGTSAAYVAAQAAKQAMARNLAAELGPKQVRVNSIAPSTTRTPLVERALSGIDSGLDWAASLHPIGRIAEPKDVAEVVAFLLSDEAAFVTGHTFRVDGGMSAA